MIGLSIVIAIQHFVSLYSYTLAGACEVWFAANHKYLSSKIQKCTWSQQKHSNPRHTLPRLLQDITPASNLSRIVVLLAIFFFLCCIPYQIGRLMEAITSKSIYRTAVFRPVRNTEHAVLLGRVTYPVRGTSSSALIKSEDSMGPHYFLNLAPCGNTFPVSYLMCL